MILPSSRNWGRILSMACIAACGGALFFGCRPSAVAFYEVLEGEVFLNLRSGLTYDSNIFARDSNEQDWIFEISPELQYLRQAGLIAVDMRSGVNFGFFHDNTQLDFQNIYSVLSLSYPRTGARRMTSSLSLSAREQSRTDATIGARTRAYVYEVDAGIRYNFSQKFAGRVRAGYLHRDFRDAERSDIDLYQIRTDGIWRYSPLLEYFLGYRFRYTDTRPTALDDGRDSMDHSLILGAEGQITPKLSGTIEGGYQTRIPEGEFSERREQFTAAAQLDWAIRTGTSLFLSASRDFDTSPNRDSLERTEVATGVSQALRDWLGARATLRYQNLRFGRADDRADDVYTGEAALDYGLTRYFSASTSYSYTIRESTRSDFDYDRHLASVEATLRF